MRQLKRLAVLMLTLFILTTLLPTVGLAEAVESGNCGVNLTWTLDDAGTLTISGVGEMDDYKYIYNESNAPWFDYLNFVKKIIIGDGVTSIGDYAFYNFNNLTGIELPESIITIGSSAFYGCSNLQSVVFPESVVTIGSLAFYHCTNLSNVSISDNIERVGHYAFAGCNLTYNLYDNGIYLGNDANPYLVLMGPASRVITSCTIHPETKIVGIWAFEFCELLETITIPDRVSIIDEYAFVRCKSLTNIIIPDSVIKINYGAFMECTSLINVYYSGSAESWAQIRIGDDNEYLTNATIHICEHTTIENGKCTSCGKELSAIIVDSVGNSVKACDSLSEAFGAVISGQTVRLCADVTEGDITIASGICLDLNGHTMIVDSVLTYSSSSIVDSSQKDTGVLRITNPDGNMINSNNCQLPVYDREAGGYRFFNVIVKSQAVTCDHKYWFKVAVENFEELYDLIQSGSKLLIKAKLSWDGESTATYATADLAFTKTWADRYKANSDIYITVSVSEAEGFENFVLTPCIYANGVEILPVEKCQNETVHNYLDGSCKDCGYRQLDYGTWSAVHSVTEEWLYLIELNSSNGDIASISEIWYLNVDAIQEELLQDLVQDGRKIITVEGEKYIEYTGKGDPAYFEINADEIIVHIGVPSDGLTDRFVLRRSSNNQAIIINVIGIDYFKVEEGMVFICQD